MAKIPEWKREMAQTTFRQAVVAELIATWLFLFSTIGCVVCVRRRVQRRGCAGGRRPIEQQLFAQSFSTRSVCVGGACVRESSCGCWTPSPPPPIPCRFTQDGGITTARQMEVRE